MVDEFSEEKPADVIIKKEDFSNGNMFLSCCMCQELFKIPKILPRCGHSVCLSCVKSLAEDSPEINQVTCPDCRVVSPLESEGVHGLKTNYQLQRIIDTLLKQNEEEDVVDDSTLCRHKLTGKTLLACSHCGKKFCKSCEILHKDELRLDIMANSSKIDSSIQHFDKKSSVESVKTRIQQEGKVQNEVLEKSFRKLKSAIAEALECRKRRFIEEIRAEIAKKESELEEVFGSIKNFKKPKGLTEFPMKPMISFSLEEMAQLHDSTLQTFHKLKEVKKWRDGIVYGKMECEEDCERVLREVLAIINNYDCLPSKAEWKSLEQAENKDLEPFINQWHVAAKQGNLELMKSIIKKREWSNATLKLLYEHKDEIDDEATALLQASLNGRIEVVKFLVETCQVSLFSKTKRSGKTVCHLAIEGSHFKVAEYLISRNAELANFRDRNKATPLHYAVVYGTPQILQLLLSLKQVDIEAESKNGKTALCYAVMKNFTEHLEILLNRGAYAGPWGENGETALHIAAGTGFFDVVKLLTKLRPSLLHVRNGEGKSAADIADGRVGDYLSQQTNFTKAIDTFE